MTTAHHLTDVRILHKECRSLAEAGYDVVVVGTGEPGPPMPGLRYVSLRKRAGRLSRMTGSAWDVYRAALNADADIYHFHDPELIPVCLLLKIRGCRVVYDVHEDLPRQVLAKPYLPGSLRPLVSWLAGAAEWVAGRMFDCIVVARQEVAPRFPPDRTVCVQNYAMLGELSLPSPQRHSNRLASIVYVGGISEIRSAQEMVQAMGLLPEQLSVRLTLVGEPDRDLSRRLAEIPGWDRVTEVGWKGRDDVAAIMGNARAGLALFHPVPNHLSAQPTKAFEYMSVGLPLIVSDFPKWRQFFEPIGCALFVDPMDPGAIASAIRWVLEHAEEAEKMGQRGQKAVRESLNWEIEARRLLGAYATLLKRRPALRRGPRV